MVPSRHNIISGITGSDKYFIINILSGNADIIDKETYIQFMGGEIPDMEEWKQKGYLVDPAEEKRSFRDKYLQFLDDRDTDEVQLFFVPTYACNFNCSYCYQDEYTAVKEELTRHKINAFFHFVENRFADRNKYITLFGGEPLTASPKHRELIEYFIDQSSIRRLDLAVVTNGYHLSDYTELLKKASIREIQVTLDGIGPVHDHRRPQKNGQPTFLRIVEGIDRALEAGLPINLRMVLDRGNIEDLPALARYAIEKGWTRNPLFKTQLGRNYELHHCQINPGRLYDRVEMYQDIHRLIQSNPQILEFHKPAFSVAKFLFEEGELPGPLFDSCPATKTEWAFDYSGRIYSCTATVGKEGEELGTYFPESKLDEDRIAEWEERDVLAIESCRDCVLQLACGGGCGSIAKNRTGSVCSPDCRPVKELLELGISTYFGKEL